MFWFRGMPRDQDGVRHAAKQLPGRSGSGSSAGDIPSAMPALRQNRIGRKAGGSRSAFYEAFDDKNWARLEMRSSSMTRGVICANSRMQKPCLTALTLSPTSAPSPELSR